MIKILLLSFVSLTIMFFLPIKDVYIPFLSNFSNMNPNFIYHILIGVGVVTLFHIGYIFYKKQKTNIKKVEIPTEISKRLFLLTLFPLEFIICHAIVISFAGLNFTKHQNTQKFKNSVFISGFQTTSVVVFVLICIAASRQ